MGEIKWKFSKKAIQSIKYSDAFVNIWEGAVRSSKTVASIIRWLQFLEESPHTEFLMSGKTENTCYRNVIGGPMGILAIVGEHRARYIKSGEGGTRLEIKFVNKDPKTRHKKKWVTKVCYVIGANDEKAESKIRGMTIGGWYADEITLYPKSFVTQALNRMSLEGAKAFWTTNPDSPYHFIKTEYIDKAKEKGYRVFHFTLDDNPALPESYKENIKKAYSGLWYKRMILGLWVMADGVIYDNFNHDPIHAGGMVCAEPLCEILRYWIGVDYGNTNATVFLLIGEGEDGRAYVLDEYYHVGGGETDMDRQKSPSQYAHDFWTWLQNHRDKDDNPIIPQAIFVDPSAKGFILELYKTLPKHIRRKILTAHNEVLLGIETVSNVISMDKLRVIARCKNTLRELASYCWDPAAQKRGVDVPLKENDHAMDALRYVIMGTRRVWLKDIAA